MRALTPSAKFCRDLGRKEGARSGLSNFKLRQCPGGTAEDHPGYTVYLCDDGLAYYIITKPGNPAYPGVIVRKVVVREGGTYIDTDGVSFGSDADQPAFKAWMNNISK